MKCVLFMSKQHCVTDKGWPVRLVVIPILACRAHLPPRGATTFGGT